MTDKFDAVILKLNEDLAAKTIKLSDVNAKIPTGTTEQRKELLDKSVKLRAEIDSLTNALHVTRVQQRLEVERQP